MLRLDGRSYSPAVLERIVSVGGLAKSYAAAADVLGLLAGVGISSRQINQLTTFVGAELAQQRDTLTAAYEQRPLPAQPRVVSPRPQLACVQLDGGRMQTRTPDSGRGVHQPHWRECKTAGFFRMSSESFDHDPCPLLPGCFSSRRSLSGLLGGLEDEAFAEEVEEQAEAFSWRPASLFRTCLSSLADSQSFGGMMAAEAETRGFFTAEKRAFLGDGLAYNWSVQQQRFPTFTAILDFIHPIQRLHALSKALHPDGEEAWLQCQAWLQAVWQGEVEEVIGELSSKQVAWGEPPADAEEMDPRVILAETITYLCNNASRMNYPAYRQAGLPLTSCLIESQIKEMNYRVKGTEKFWNDGIEGEAILQVRAALLSHDDRLAKHFAARPGSPYARERKKTAMLAAEN